MGEGILALAGLIRDGAVMAGAVTAT